MLLGYSKAEALGEASLGFSMETCLDPQLVRS